MSTDDPRFGPDAMVSSYIERLTALSRERGTSMDADDLRAVARDLGLSDADLARAEAVADEHMVRGRNFLQHRAFAEAIAELGQAAALRPLDVTPLCLLGRAHLGRLQATGDGHDRAQAETLARRAIELDAAHMPAYELLAAARGHTGPPRAAPRRLAGIAAAGALVATAAGAGYWLLAPVREPAPVSTELDVASGTPGSVGAQPSRASVAPASRTQADIPLTLVENDHSRGLSLAVERSQLRHFTRQSAFAYDLDATLTLTVASAEAAGATGFELHQARAQLELLDAAGQPVRQRSMDLRADYLPYLRPGDSTAVRALIGERQDPPPIRSARVIITSVDMRPAAERYDLGQPVELIWPGGQPAHIAVEVHVRASEIKKLAAKHGHWLSLSVRNGGSRPIERLRLAIARYSADGAQLATGMIYAVPSAGPALPGGQTWVIRDITDLPAPHTSFARFTITVIEAE